MPRLDGIEACKMIMTRFFHSDGRKLPEIAFVTADTTEDFKREALRAGGNGFISKPFTAKAIEMYFLENTRLNR